MLAWLGIFFPFCEDFKKIESILEIYGGPMHGKLLCPLCEFSSSLHGVQLTPCSGNSWMTKHFSEPQKFEETLLPKLFSGIICHLDLAHVVFGLLIEFVHWSAKQASKELCHHCNSRLEMPPVHDCPLPLHQGPSNNSGQKADIQASAFTRWHCHLYVTYICRTAGNEWVGPVWPTLHPWCSFFRQMPNRFPHYYRETFCFLKQALHARMRKHSSGPNGCLKFQNRKSLFVRLSCRGSREHDVDLFCPPPLLHIAGKSHKTADENKNWTTDNYLHLSSKWQWRCGMSRILVT